MVISRRQFSGFAAAALFGSAAQAQSYPVRPIKLVIPFPPGGAFDAVGRPWAERMKEMPATIIVENMGGGGSSIGAAAVVRAQPDGYTLLLGGTQTHVNEALLKTKPLYDPMKDLQPISGVAANVLCIAVHPSVSVKTLQELVSYARSNPDKLVYGHSGTGSIQHLAGELFKQLTDTPNIVPVPYRGTGPVITDLIAGQIPMGTPGVTRQVIELHRAEKIRVLAVTGSSRLTAAPEIPTAVEQGLPSLTVVGSIGLLGPAGTPPNVAEHIAASTRKIVGEPAFRQMLTEAGIEPSAATSPEKFRESLAADLALWSPVVQKLGLRVD